MEKRDFLRECCRSSGTSKKLMIKSEAVEQQYHCALVRRDVVVPDVNLIDTSRAVKDMCGTGVMFNCVGNEERFRATGHAVPGKMGAIVLGWWVLPQQIDCLGKTPLKVCAM